MDFVIPGCATEPSARVSSKMLHLTYAALYNGELTFDGLLTAAKGWGAARQGLREYCIGRELHPKPADPQRDWHFHTYIKFGKKVEARYRLHLTAFDLQGRGGRILHPEIQSVINTSQ